MSLDDLIAKDREPLGEEEALGSDLCLPSWVLNMGSWQRVFTPSRQLSLQHGYVTATRIVSVEHIIPSYPSAAQPNSQPLSDTCPNRDERLVGEMEISGWEFH